MADDVGEEEVHVVDWGSSRLLVRSAEYADAMTGCTLLVFGDKAEAVSGVGAGAAGERCRPATCSCDVRGGSPGTLMSTDGRVDAILFVGGSTLGFAALDGVYVQLLKAVRARARAQAAAAERQHRVVGWETIPVVRGGVIYDWAWRTRVLLERVGDRPTTDADELLLNRYPDAALGKALFADTTDTDAGPPARDEPDPLRVRIGRVGAGCGASCGKLYGLNFAEAGGQGFASWSGGADSRARIVVLTILNSIGAVVNGAGSVVLGNRSAVDGCRRHPFAGVGSVSLRKDGANANMGVRVGGVGGDEAVRGGDGDVGAGAGENTTLTCLVVNISLDAGELRQLARMVHSSMARCIQPFHCPNDGDILYAVSTHEVERDALDDVQILGTVASDVARDAVLSIAHAYS